MDSTTEAPGPVDLHPQVSYFGGDQKFKVVLPDGVSWIEHTKLMEGARKRYLNATNRDVVVSQRTEEARLKLAPGDDRHELLKVAISGWNLLGPDGSPLAFNDLTLRSVLEQFPPEVLDLVEKDVRDKNPWLNSEITVEQIDEQIVRLEELRAKRVAEEEGKVSSAS